MHLHHLLSLLPLLSSVVTAFTVPAGLPDGNYLVTVDANSTASFEKLDLGAYAPVRRSRAASRVRRQTTQWSFGGTGKEFPNHDDYNLCTEAWRTFSREGKKVPGHMHFLSTNGEAVLAGCNYQNRDFEVGYWRNPYLVDEFNGIADARIGWWKTGWVNFREYNFGFLDFTFWRDIRGTQFCTNLP